MSNDNAVKPRWDKAKGLVVAALFLLPTTVSADWGHLTTEHTVVHYRTTADLERLNKKLKLGNRGFLGLFPTKDPHPAKEALRNKVDYIFEDVQGQLDMYNCGIIKVQVYTSQEEINRIFYGHVAQGADCTAFYFHKLKTVYISLERVTEGVLAHEFAHAILDHYFVIRPPTAVAELLAQHVDKHLNRGGYDTKR